MCQSVQFGCRKGVGPGRIHQRDPFCKLAGLSGVLFFALLTSGPYRRQVPLSKVHSFRVSAGPILSYCCNVTISPKQIDEIMALLPAQSLPTALVVGRVPLDPMSLGCSLPFCLCYTRCNATAAFLD